MASLLGLTESYKTRAVRVCVGGEQPKMKRKNQPQNTGFSCYKGIFTSLPQDNLSSSN